MNHREEVKFKLLPKIENIPKEIDLNFFNQMDVKVTVLQWYQIALSHPDLKQGRFIWYTTTGTLIYEWLPSNKPFNRKFFNSEEVYDEIMKEVNK